MLGKYDPKENLTRDFIGEKPCQQCGEVCYTCIAANIEKNLLPNLCFINHCKMTHIETAFRQKVYKALNINVQKPIGFLNNDNQNNDNINMSNTVAPELLERYQSLVVAYETTLVKLLEAFQDMGLILSENYIKTENKLEEISRQNLDTINLIIAGLLNKEE